MTLIAWQGLYVAVGLTITCWVDVCLRRDTGRGFTFSVGAVSVLAWPLIAAIVAWRMVRR